MEPTNAACEHKYWGTVIVQLIGTRSFETAFFSRESRRAESKYLLVLVHNRNVCVCVCVCNEKKNMSIFELNVLENNCVK